jgi:hypothetical protein
MNKRALSLVEVVIAMSLMTVLAALTMSLLTTANAFLGSGTQRSDQARLYAVLSEKLSDEFFHMGSRHRFLSVDRTRCAQRSAWSEEQQFVTDTQGYPLWQSWVEFFVLDSQLVRRRKPLEGPGLLLDDLKMEWDTTDVLVSNVESGRWDPVDTDSVVLTLQVPIDKESRTLEFLLTAGQGDAL